MNRIYVNDESIIVHDPTPEIMGFLKTINPAYEINSVFHEQEFIPKFQECRNTTVTLDLCHLAEMSLPDLLDNHKSDHHKSHIDSHQNYATLLDLKKEIGFRQMRECSFCSRQCKTNRYQDKGLCGLDYRTYHQKPFIHIGEEDVIKPAIVVNFAGCSMDCVFCIESNVKNPDSMTLLNIKELWAEIQGLLKTEIPLNTLEFAGGDPTESLPWIFEILRAAPDDFNLPIVWNSNLYAAKDSIDLLDGIVDVYLPDFTFGNNECAEQLSGVTNYWETARNSAEAIISNGQRAIFRILVLPNHLKCCHEPVLKYLTNFKDKIWVSILDQYIPEHNAYRYPDIKRRPTREEISEVESLAAKFGLRNIASEGGTFWNT